MQVSDFTAILKADFGRFRPVSACFGRISSIGRRPIRPIWPIRPDFGRISPIRRESKPIRHESSRIGANQAKSARIKPSRRESEKKKKKKKPRRGPTRGQPRRTPRPASDAGAAPLVPRPCFLGLNAYSSFSQFT